MAQSSETTTTLSERIQLAKSKYDAKLFDAAADIYVDCVDEVIAKHGDTSMEYVDVALPYAVSLFRYAQDLAKLQILKKANEIAKQKEKESKAQSSYNKVISNLSDGEDDDEDEEQEEDENAEDKLNIEDASPEDIINTAWAYMDSVRAVVSAKLKEDPENAALKVKLTKAYANLGDMDSELEQFDIAIQDYSSALNYSDEKALVADLNVQIAVCFMYLGKEHETLPYYKAAEKALTEYAASLPDENETKQDVLSSLEDIRIRIEELGNKNKETVDREIQRQFSNSASSSSSSISDKPVHILQPRRKGEKRPAPEDTNQNQDDNKKLRKE